MPCCCHWWLLHLWLLPCPALPGTRFLPVVRPGVFDYLRAHNSQVLAEATAAAASGHSNPKQWQHNLQQQRQPGGVERRAPLQVLHLNGPAGAAAGTASDGDKPGVQPCKGHNPCKLPSSRGSQVHRVQNVACGVQGVVL